MGSTKLMFLLGLLTVSTNAQYYDEIIALGKCVDNCVFNYSLSQPIPCSSQEPTVIPTEAPTYVPTEEPTPEPTVTPTEAPTEEPTIAPEPTYEPTEEPTYEPTEEPTPEPTEDPSGTYRMTTWFPMGSCKMNGVSVPYTLSFKSHTAGRVCFKISLTPDYVAECAKRDITWACDYMVKTMNKLVFWYKLTDSCGFELTKSHQVSNLFPWRLKINGKTYQAVNYAFYAANATGPHAIGPVNLFKWGYTTGGKLQTSVEVEVNRPTSFKRAADASLDGYTMCLSYDPDVIDAFWCITQDNLVKYSFYDPKKQICTKGVVNVDENVIHPL